MLKVGGHLSIMNAIKAGWPGQKFAQAKHNVSGGKKSRIRLPKEERKEMVESFIKKYQSSNNWNFPSLNLTHKEVGGSFYTIREIVREIIQENRVLAPAKSLPDDLDSDQLFKQNPLGTISTEAEASQSVPLDGSPLVSYQHEDTTEELYIISDKVYAQHAKEQIFNGSHVNFSNKEFHEVEVANEQHETKKIMEELPVSRAKVIEVEDVTVETFPLKHATQQIDNLDGNSGEAKDLKGALAEKDVEKVLLGPQHDSSFSDGTSLSPNASLVHDKDVENIVDHLEGDSKLIDGKAVKATEEDLMSGSSNSFTTKNDDVHHAQVDIDVEVKPSPNDMANAETKVVNTANVTETNSLNGVFDIGKSPEPTNQEEAVKGDKADIQPGGSAEKRSSPTLDRINLESWEGESNKKPETNPVVATVKSIITAIVKFWSN